MEHRVGGGGSSQVTLGESVLQLREKMESLSIAISSINASFTQQATDTSLTNHRLQSLEESSTSMKSNLSQRVSSIEAWQSIVQPARITKLSSDVASLQDTASLHSHSVHNLTQSMDVVKGVEKRLEGSQVQLASSVSELKQQLLKVEKLVSSLRAASAVTPPSTPVSATPHTATAND